MSSILLLTTSILNIGPNNFIDLATILNNRGHECVLVYSGPPVGAEMPDGIRAENVWPEARVRNRLVRFIRRTLAYVRVLVGVRSDIIITSGEHALACAWLFQLICFRPSSHYYYALECPIDRDTSSLRRRLLCCLLRRVTKVIVPNEHRARLLKRLLPAVNIDVVHNAPSIQRAAKWPDAQMSCEFGVPPSDKKLVIYTGGLRLENYIAELCAASHDLGGDVEVLLVGPIAASQELEIRALLENANHRVLHYHAAVDAVTLAGLRAKAYVSLVFWRGTNWNTKYCAPNKLYEAIAVGVPVICSNNPSLRNLLRKRNVGLCVNAAEPSEISRAIHLLVGDSFLRETMSANAKAWFRESMNYDFQISPVLDAISRATNYRGRI